MGLASGPWLDESLLYRDLPAVLAGTHTYCLYIDVYDGIFVFDLTHCPPWMRDRGSATGREDLRNPSEMQLGAGMPGRRISGARCLGPVRGSMMPLPTGPIGGAKLQVAVEKRLRASNTPRSHCSSRSDKSCKLRKSPSLHSTAMFQRPARAVEAVSCVCQARGPPHCASAGLFGLPACDTKYTESRHSQENANAWKLPIAGERRDSSRNANLGISPSSSFLLVMIISLRGGISALFGQLTSLPWPDFTLWHHLHPAPRLCP